MTVTLTPHHAAMVRQQVDSGRYATADDVIDDALRALDERDRLHRLRASLAEAEAEFDRGEGVEWTPELMEQIRKEADRAANDGADAVPNHLPHIRRLTSEEQRRALAALERAERTQERILAERGGQPFSPSWELVNEARDERTRHLP